MANSMSQLLDLYSRSLSERLQKQMQDEQMQQQASQFAASQALAREQLTAQREDQAARLWESMQARKSSRELSEAQLGQQRDIEILRGREAGSLVPSQQTIPIPSLYGAPTGAMPVEATPDITSSGGRGFIATTPAYRAGEAAKAQRQAEIESLRGKSEFFKNLFNSDNPDDRLMAEVLSGRSLTPTSMLEGSFQLGDMEADLANMQSKLDHLAASGKANSSEYKTLLQEKATLERKYRGRKAGWKLFTDAYKERAFTPNADLNAAKYAELQDIQRHASAISRSFDAELTKNPALAGNANNMAILIRRKATEYAASLNPSDKRFFEQNYEPIMSALRQVGSQSMKAPSDWEALIDRLKSGQ